MILGFTGYYGMQNYGDDLFVVACIMATEELLNSKVNVLSSPLENIEGNFLVRNRFELYSGESKKSKIYRMFKMSELFFKSDLVFLAGGSTLSSSTSNNMRRFQEKLLDINLSKVGAIGVSVGPFDNKSDFQKAKNFINKMEYISVRDESSFRILQEMGIETPHYLGNDLAGVLPKFIQQEVNVNKIKKLGISLCYYELYTNGDILIEEKDINNIIQGIKLYCEYVGNLDVTIFILNNHEKIGDQKISRLLKNQLKNIHGVNLEVIEHKGDPIFIWKEISKMDFMFSNRLHGAITAYLTNVPFILFEYHQKCKDFLDYIGYPEENRLQRVIKSEIVVVEKLKNLSKNSYNVKMSPEIYTQKSLQAFKNILL